MDYQLLERVFRANLQEINVWFLLLVGLAAYVFTAFLFRKTPDPSTQYGLSLNAILAWAVSLLTAMAAFIVFLVAGKKYGYPIVLVIFPVVLYRIIKSMTSEDCGTMSG